MPQLQGLSLGFLDYLTEIVVRHIVRHLGLRTAYIMLTSGLIVATVDQNPIFTYSLAIIRLNV